MVQDFGGRQTVAASAKKKYTGFLVVKHQKIPMPLKNKVNHLLLVIIFGIWGPVAPESLAAYHIAI